MHDFESKKRQILGRVDLLDVVSEHVNLKRRGRRWVGLCPFHTEKTPSFTVTPELGLFKCFGCGKGGDIFSFVQSRENVSFMEALKILADRAGVELEHVQRGPSGEPNRAELAKVNAWAERFFRSCLLSDAIGRQAREYLQSRQVIEATAERFGIGLATDGGPGLREAAGRAGIDLNHLRAADFVRGDEGGRVYDTFRNRLMFPIRDATRRVIGFGGRTLTDDRAKYLNTRQTVLFDKGRGLYGIELARDTITARRRAIVVEGYTDCIAAHQAGFTETVATLGTALADAQVDLLRRYCDEIILLFDSDQAGEAAADRAIRVALPRCVAVRLARIPEGKDPSEFLSRAGSERFSDVLNRAVDALEFKWSQARARFDGDTSDAGRREAILDFLRVIAEAFRGGAVDAIRRGQLGLQVAHLLHMEVGEVNRLIGRLQGKGARGGSRPTGTVPVNKEHAAWVTVLEVLLNEPALSEAVADLSKPQDIVDERDRRIIGIVRGLARESGEFGLADALARGEDGADAERIEELARRGAIRGNYARTLEVAVERIRRISADRDEQKAREELLSNPGTREARDDTTAQLANLQRRLNEQQRPFFVRRLARRTVDEGGSMRTGSATESADVEKK